ncbi:prolidase [Streptomyces malaysiensis]|uniref:Prolidase n=2 Tax=Streptomyces malaysiensis TaxID=92644 RepID=A0A7X5WY77_STRMQ|nr:prolidase [Streptomyces malaysiensis]
MAEAGEPLSCCPEIGYVMHVCDGPYEVLKYAREQLRRGADHIKVMASGGAMSPTDDLEAVQYTPEELRAAVTAARSAGTYVMAHAIAPEAIRNCVDAGVRSIEHGNLIDDETAKLMAEAGTFLVPTMAVVDLTERVLEKLAARAFDQDDPRDLAELRKVGESAGGPTAVGLTPPVFPNHRASVVAARSP